MTDPKERRAFLKLYDARDPQKRRSLAKAFLAGYPRSWLLAQAYEIASKACIDLESSQRAGRAGTSTSNVRYRNVRGKARKRIRRDPVLPAVSCRNLQIVARNWNGPDAAALPAGNIIGDFHVNNQFSDSSGALVARMITNRDKRYFMIRAQPGPNGEMNYQAPEATFPPTYLSRPYAEISRRGFYIDGRFRETTFIVEAFRRSACFRRGQAHCGSCHLPHASDASSNPTSLKFAADPDHMCVQCHGKFIANPGAHTHHPASSEGARCVACHMPRIMNSVLFKARTHQIDDIPNAEMTERFGQAESPHACILCHADKDAQWAGVRLRNC